MIRLPVSRNAVDFDRQAALVDVRQIVTERGKAVTIHLRGEENVSRDKLGSIKSRTTERKQLNFYAFPIRFNVTEKYMEKVGLREKTQVIIHTAMQDWLDQGYSMNQLKDLDMIRMTVVIDSVKYEIKDKSLYIQLGDSFLYVVLGLNKI